jgi:hypothetical protein
MLAEHEIFGNVERLKGLRAGSPLSLSTIASWPMKWSSLVRPWFPVVWGLPALSEDLLALVSVGLGLVA